MNNIVKPFNYSKQTDLNFNDTHTILNVLFVTSDYRKFNREPVTIYRNALTATDWFLRIV